MEVSSSVSVYHSYEGKVFSSYVHSSMPTTTGPPSPSPHVAIVKRFFWRIFC